MISVGGIIYDQTKLFVNVILLQYFPFITYPLYLPGWLATSTWPNMHSASYWNIKILISNNKTYSNAVIDYLPFQFTWL